MGGCTSANNKIENSYKQVEKPSVEQPIIEIKPDPEFRNGKWYYKDESIYEGEMKNGKPDGKGIFIGKNGDRYEGEIKNGYRHGHGILIDKDKTRSEGTFIDGLADGHLKMIYINGCTYEGSYRKGKRNGHGVIVSHLGWKYEGNYINGEMSGKGMYTFACGDKYTGDFNDGKFNGFGILTYTNGSTVVGYFVDDKKHGRCLVTSIDIDINNTKLITIHDGLYANGIKNGDGLMTCNRTNGSTEITRGTWKNNKLHGYCEISVDGILFYKGFYQDGYAVSPTSK